MIDNTNFCRAAQPHDVMDLRPFPTAIEKAIRFVCNASTGVRVAEIASPFKK
ncbi:hypothetical protein [Tumebacillus algifaecis]|uniref:hypothetical protein n=1 Tax=Tumebacillus algifaecis TaxID=1214604 RepID=UPI0012FD51A6|nr:hypothetical protein [Tumebacillus algifaecis]